MILPDEAKIPAVSHLGLIVNRWMRELGDARRRGDERLVRYLDPGESWDSAVNSINPSSELLLVRRAATQQALDHTSPELHFLDAWINDLACIPTQVDALDLVKQLPFHASPHRQDLPSAAVRISSAELYNTCVAGPEQTAIYKAWNIHPSGWTDELGSIAHSSSVRTFAMQYLVREFGQDASDLVGLMSANERRWIRFESFQLASTPGSFSVAHVDEGGCGTMATMRAGVQLWFVRRIKDPIEGEGQAAEVTVDMVLLTEGDEMIMLPGTSYFVYTHGPAICLGRTFINYAWLELHLDRTRITASDDSNEYLPHVEIYVLFLAIALADPRWVRYCELSSDQVVSYATQLLKHVMASSEPYLGPVRDADDRQLHQLAQDARQLLRPFAIWTLRSILDIKRGDRPTIRRIQEPTLPVTQPRAGCASVKVAENFSDMFIDEHFSDMLLKGTKRKLGAVDNYSDRPGQRQRGASRDLDLDYEV